MFRYVVSYVLFSCILVTLGCALPIDPNINFTSEPLNAVSVQPESDEEFTYILPSDSQISAVPPRTTHHTEVHAYVQPECVCEFEGWEEHGLLCMGIVCSSECTREVRECNERTRACIPNPNISNT